MIRRFCYSLFFFTIIFFTNSNAMKKGKLKNAPKSASKSAPKSIPKNMAELIKLLSEIAPTQEEYCSVPSEVHLEPFYEKLHEGYSEILKYKNNHRKLAREHFSIVAAGHIHDEDGFITVLPYAPAYYALGVMALEDNNLDQAKVMFEEAVKTSYTCRQQRKAYVSAFYAQGLVEIERKKQSDACLTLAHLYTYLEPHEYETWQPKIRTTLTEITNKIDVHWRKPLALLINNDKKKRASAFDEYKSCLKKLLEDNIPEELSDFHSTLLVIRSLADNNLSPDARLIMALLHSCQYNKKNCTFSLQPTNPIDEFEKALRYMNSEEVSECKYAKSVRGEINYAYGRFLESNFPKDAATREKTRELFRQSALYEYEPGCGRYAHACLENAEEPLTDEQAISHLQMLRRLSRNGIMGFQDALAKIFYFGHKFGCGYTLKPDINESYQHANNNPASLDMLVLQGIILMRGIKKEIPKNKNIWDLEPNVQNGEEQIEKAISVDQELTYLRLDEIFKSESTPQEIKDSIFKFVQKKQAGEKPNLHAIRCFGDILLSSGRIDEAVRLLESISTVHNNPQGYCELSKAFLCGIGVQQDLGQATNYCIKALIYFDEKTIKSKAAAQTMTHLEELLITLNSPEHKDKAQVQKLLEELSTQMNLCGIRYIIKKAKE